MYITSDLIPCERKVSSQFGEDGILEQIASDLGIQRGTYFEFGISPGSFEATTLEGNFVEFQKRGWKGVFLDGAGHLAQYGVRQEFITPLNINRLYQKHGVPPDLDFMSIDIDGQEFWVWMNLQFRPKVMIIEINGGLGPDLSQTIMFDPQFLFDGSTYYGCSYQALSKLAQSKGYTPVWCNGVNVACIRDDLISNRDDFVGKNFHRPYTAYAPDALNRPWVMI